MLSSFATMVTQQLLLNTNNSSIWSTPLHSLLWVNHRFKTYLTGVFPRNFSSRCINCGWLSEFSSNADPSVTDLGLGSVLADVSVSSWSDIWSSTNWQREEYKSYTDLMVCGWRIIWQCALGIGWGPYIDLGTSLAKMLAKISARSNDNCHNHFLQSLQKPWIPACH